MPRRAVSLIAAVGTLSAGSLLFAPAVAPLRAQEGVSARGTALTLAPRPVRATVARTDSLTRTAPLHPPVDVVAPAVVVTGARKGFHVVHVPVPAAFGDGRTATYVIVPTGAAAVLGRRDGVLSAGDARGVSFTVGVPTDARAGRAQVASVVFSAPGAPTVEVPVGLNVLASRRIELRMDATLVSARSGERVTIGYALMNLGTAPDTVAVALAVPQGWRVDGGDGVTLVRPGDAVHRQVTVQPPRGLIGGRFPLRLTASVAGAAVAGADLVVALDGASDAAVASNTTSLRIGALAARGPWDGTATGASYALTGQLTETMQLTATAVSTPVQGSASQLALARAGLAPVPAALAITGRTFRLAAGPVGGTLTELTGTSVGGQGAALTLTQPRWSASALATRPLPGPTPYGTNALHAQVATAVGGARIITAVSSLRESLGPIGSARRLDAISAGIETGSQLDRRLASELAYRRYNGGAGLGVSASASFRGEHGSLDLRASHAAGGTEAFARGSDELSLSATRRLGARLDLTSTAWRLADRDRGARALQTAGWSVGASSRLATALSASLGVRSFGYTSSATTGSFGSADRSVYGALQAHVGKVNADVDGSIGERSRTLSGGTATGVNITDRALASRYGARVHMRGSAGLLALSSAVSTTGNSLGVVPRQVEVGLNAEQVPLLTRGATRLVLGAGATRMTSFVTPGAWITTMRGSVGAELPLGVTVSLEAERNPMYFVNTLDALRAQRWMYVTRVERTLAIPALSRANRVDGVVFADVNGDGRRGRDEAGLRGIVVRRGAEMSTTDADGRYRFVGASGDAPEIDVRSLPVGLVAGAKASVRGGDLAVTTLSALDVILQADAADSTRVTAADLAKAVLSVRDASGRVWVARLVPSAGAGVTARFDALPPGTYQLTADFSQGVEPLRIKGAVPTIRVDAGARPPVQLTVQPRPLRFQSARPVDAPATRTVGESSGTRELRQQEQR